MVNILYITLNKYFFSHGPILGKFMELPSEYQGDQLTAVDATVKSIAEKRSDLAKNVIDALEKRYSESNNSIVQACIIASLKSWPPYSEENESEQRGIACS